MVAIATCSRCGVQAEIYGDQISVPDFYQQCPVFLGKAQQTGGAPIRPEKDLLDCPDLKSAIDAATDRGSG